MGMAYQFKVAKKSDIPDNVKFYKDALDRHKDVLRMNMKAKGN